MIRKYIIAGVANSVLIATSTAAQVQEAEPREATVLRLGDEAECLVDDRSPAFVGSAESSAALSLLAEALAKAGSSAAVNLARVFVKRGLDANTPPPVIVSTGVLSVQLDPVDNEGRMRASSPLSCISISHGVRNLARDTSSQPEVRDSNMQERVRGLDPFGHFHEGDGDATFDAKDLDRLALLEPPEVYAEIWLDWHDATAFRPILGAVYFRESLAPINSGRQLDLAITVTLSLPGGENETAFAFALTDLKEGTFYPAGYFTASSPWIVNPAAPDDKDLEIESANPVRMGLVNVQVSLQQSQEPGLLLSYANQMLTLLDTADVETAAEKALGEVLDSRGSETALQP